MYEKLVKRLRECTAEQNGEKTLWHQAAIAPEELNAIAESNRRSMETWAKEATEAVEALDSKVPKWIKFKFRSPTREEKAKHPDWVYVLDCKTPDDGEEILASNGKWVWTDAFYFNGDDCCMDSGHDLEGLWWMPLPEPPKEEDE